jgi:hypothetical protein
LIHAGVPHSTDRVNILDLTSFLAPRRLDAKPGDALFNVRWDIITGPDFNQWITVTDMVALFAGSNGFPPMNSGNKVFTSGFVCTPHPIFGR